MRRGNNCAFPPLGNAMPRTKKNEWNETPAARRFFSLCFKLYIRAYQNLRVSYSAPTEQNSLLVTYKCGRWQCLPKLICCYEAVKRYTFFSRYCSLDFKGWKFTYWLKAQLRHLRCLPRTFEVTHMRVHIDCDFMMSVSGYKVWVGKFNNFFTIRRVFRKCKTSSRSICPTALGLSVIVLRRRRRK